MRKRRRSSRSWLVFLCCTLAVPTIAQVMGIYTADMPVRDMLPALMVGALLGVAHVLLRPLLRLLFAPVGCLTLGLFGLVIDVGLIYLCGAMVPGFVMPGFLYALLTALAINAVCALAAGRV